MIKKSHLLTFPRRGNKIRAVRTKKETTSYYFLIKRASYDRFSYRAQRAETRNEFHATDNAFYILQYHMKVLIFF